MKLLSISVILLAASLANAEALYCRVVGVTDGDTITCLTAQKEQLKIRLYQIDAPERKQAFGTRSKQALSNLIFNKTVKVEMHKKDKYKRTLGTIYSYIPASCPDSPHIGRCARLADINLEMINYGMAWYYPFAKKNPVYQEAQNKAKANKKGLWSQQAITPWDFRKQQRNKK